MEPIQQLSQAKKSVIAKTIMIACMPSRDRFGDDESMTQCHSMQYGIFHITTNAWDGIPWCASAGIPELLIENLCKTRDVQHAKLYAFCILLNHMHIIVRASWVEGAQFVRAIIQGK